MRLNDALPVQLHYSSRVVARGCRGCAGDGQAASLAGRGPIGPGGQPPPSRRGPMPPMPPPSSRRSPGHCPGALYTPDQVLPQAVPCAGEVDAIAVLEDKSDAVKLYSMPNGRVPRIRCRSLLRHHTVGKKHEVGLPLALAAAGRCRTFTRPTFASHAGDRRHALQNGTCELGCHVQPRVRGRAVLPHAVAGRSRCPASANDASS